MYYLLSLFAGLLITGMVASNGVLSEHYGVYTGVVIVHVVGLTVMSLIMLIRRESPFQYRASKLLYMGGAVGVMTVVFNNMAFGIISISAILALILLGQSILGLAVDQYGLMGMPKHPFRASKLIGLVFIVAGIAFMIDSFDLVAVSVSIAAGFCIIISRTLNAKLSEKSTIQTSAFFNNLVGLIVSLMAFVVFGRAELTAFVTFDPNIVLYLGGIFGIGVVLVNNLTVTKISAFYLTLLMFVGQIFSALIFDKLLGYTFEFTLLVGGILVVMGLSINLLLDRARTSEAS